MSRKSTGNIALFIFCFFWVCCNQKISKNDSVTRMAELECRAISLRNQRFQLANTIRFAEDSILKNLTADSGKIKSELVLLQQQKESLLQRSLSLSDTIRKQLDSLEKNVFNGAESKQQFNDELQKAMSNLDCD